MVRKPWVSVTVAAMCAVAIGPSLIADPESYPPGPYEYTFAMMTPRAWGVVFIALGALFIGGVLAPSWRHHVEAQRVLCSLLAGFLALILFFWAGFLVAAKVDAGGPPISWNGPAVWTTLALVHLVSFSRFGTGRR